jgi:hypothetical protein
VTLTESPPAEEQRQSRGAGRAIGVAGLLISLVATVVTAVAELYLTPLRIGGVPIGVAIPFAAAANWGLAWFAVTTTGRRWAIGPAWALWTLLMLFAAGARTTEGDYLISGADWVALAMILVGSLTFAVYAYRAILRRPVVSGGYPPAKLRDHPPADR